MYRINQVVDMNGEMKRYEQTVNAEVLERKDRYLRYTEQLDDYEIDVVMRVGDDFIKIQRRGIINMNFHFQQWETTDTFYESLPESIISASIRPYSTSGKWRLRSVTNCTTITANSGIIIIKSGK